MLARLFKLLVFNRWSAGFSGLSQHNANAPVILSYGLWQSRYGGDPSMAGRKIIVNGENRIVTGVLPRDFHLFDENTGIWMPIALPDARTEDHSFRSWLIAVGKLKPQATIALAQAEMTVLSQRIALAHPESNNDWTAKVDSIQEAQFGEWKSILYPLWGAVIFVLLIACAMFANLFLGRLVRRAREISVRAALGATRRRLVLQLLNEGLLIGIIGGGGVLLTGWGIDLFVLLAPDYFPLLHLIHLNITVLLFCLSISSLSGALLAVVPAFWNKGRFEHRSEASRAICRRPRACLVQKRLCHCANCALGNAALRRRIDDSKFLECIER